MLAPREWRRRLKLKFASWSSVVYQRNPRWMGLLRTMLGIRLLREAVIQIVLENLRLQSDRNQVTQFIRTFISLTSSKIIRGCAIQILHASRQSSMSSVMDFKIVFWNGEYTASGTYWNHTRFCYSPFTSSSTMVIVQTGGSLLFAHLLKLAILVHMFESFYGPSSS